MAGESGWLPLGGGAANLDDLGDVDVSTVAPLNAQALVFNSADSLWKPGTVSGGGGTTATLMHVREEQADGTSAGTFTSGAWRTRVLNTVVTNDIVGASLASNVITLPAGTFEVDALAPAFRVGGHQARLYDVTNSAELLLGMTGAYSQPSSTGGFAPVRGEFTLSATTDIRLEHACATTVASNGLGLAFGGGGLEVFSEVLIWKVA